MRLPFLLSLFTALSCGLASTSKKTLNLANEPVNAAKAKSVYGSRELWQKISERPDSVGLLVKVNDTITVLLVLSGRLDNAYYKLETTWMHLPSGKQQVFVANEHPLVWVQGQRQPFVSFGDMNFDGSADLHLFDNAGTVNYWNRVWLYRPSAGFRYSKDLSTTPCPQLDINRKQILSYYNMQDGCAETVGYYTVDHDTLKPFRYYFTQQEGDSCMTYQKELIGNEWKETKLGEWKASLYDSLYRSR